MATSDLKLTMHERKLMEEYARVHIKIKKNAWRPLGVFLVKIGCWILGVKRVTIEAGVK